MVRLMVTSAAYRQDSNLRPELKDIDPGNRLLASQNPRRLEAEFVRDNALAAAGLLNLPTSAGPASIPYQPAGYYANIQFPDRKYVPEADDRQYRRGVYMHWQRTFLHPMLANFDAPSREDSVCTRERLQHAAAGADAAERPEFVEAARVLAEHAMAAAPDDDGRLDFIYQRVLSPRAEGEGARVADGVPGGAAGVLPGEPAGRGQAAARGLRPGAGRRSTSRSWRRGRPSAGWC